MPFLSNNDLYELTNAWNSRRDDAFKQKIEDDFVDYLVRNIPSDLADRLHWAIQNAESPRDLSVGFANGDVHFRDDHVFTAEGWGQRKMSVKQVIYRTNALTRVAEAIGPSITVQHRFHNGIVSFTIHFWPPRVIHPPGGDIYADMPPLETGRVNNPEDEYSEAD